MACISCSGSFVGFNVYLDFLFSVIVCQIQYLLYWVLLTLGLRILEVTVNFSLKVGQSRLAVSFDLELLCFIIFCVFQSFCLF